MTHLPALIQDLGLILVAAAVVTLICKKLKQPIVLGYLIAGFIVSPHFPLLPVAIKDTESISTWAEIGVIFMLFGLGLEFSFKKLTKVGKSASITATFEIVFMIAIGYVAGQILGWNSIDSIFLGAILSMSSTTIIVKAFDELALKGKSFVSLVFGVLIVEDLIAILLLVLLSSIAVTQSFSGTELLSSSFRLVFFLVLWFILGIYILPLLLRKYKDLLSDETLLIVSVGLCLLMVIIACSVGFSPALGAFVMGSILAETSKGAKIEHLTLPVKDLFSAVFFVSVGMMIDPKILQEYFSIIVFITVLTIIGKFIGTSFGALISGRKLGVSVQAGVSMAQIGEFSFIIATLGTTLKVTSDFLYPIAVAVSAVTTFTTPYLIKSSNFFATAVEKRLPSRLKDALSKYEVAMSSNSSGNVLHLVWNTYGVKIFLNSIIIIALTLSISHLVVPILGENFNIDKPSVLSIGACALTLLLSTPFLWAVFFGVPGSIHEYSAENIAQLQKLQIGVSLIRFIIGCALIIFIVGHYTSLYASTGVLIISLSTLGVFFLSRFSEPVYRRIEGRFLSNLTEKERAEMQNKAKVPDLAPWDVNLAEFTVSQHSPIVAKSLQESGIKDQFGVTVAMIERGGVPILAPKGFDIFLPFDKVFLIGTDDQLSAAGAAIEDDKKPETVSDENNYGLVSLVLEDKDSFVNKQIRQSGVREAVNGLIVGIEREGQRYLNPEPTMVLLAGDNVWMVAERSLVASFKRARRAKA